MGVIKVRVKSVWELIETLPDHSINEEVLADGKYDLKKIVKLYDDPDYDSILVTTSPSFTADMVREHAGKIITVGEPEGDSKLYYSISYRFREEWLMPNGHKIASKFINQILS